MAMNSTVVAVGDKFNAQGGWFTVTVAGTLAAAAPTYNMVNIGDTTADGTATVRYDGIYSSAKSFGLLVEPAATNLLTYSEQFDNAAWAKSSTITPNTHVAPDGNMTADTVTWGGGNYMFQISSAAGVANETTAGSVFVKAIGATTSIQVRIDRNGIAQGNQATYTISSTKWTRIEHVATLDANTSPPVLRLDYINGNVAVWGGQLEQSSVVTSYIPTTTASVTRATEAGNINWPITGNFNSIKGYFVFDFDMSQLNAGDQILSLNGVANSLLYLSAANTLAMTDGTSSATVSAVAGKINRCIGTWETGGNMQLSVKPLSDYAATWTDGVAVAYDGTFTEGANISIGDTLTVPLTVRNTPIIYDAKPVLADIKTRFT